MNNIAKSILALLAAAAPAVAQAQTDTVPVDSLADIPTIELDDLVITANKTVIKSDGAKLTYNVAEDESSKGQSVLDALRKVPMVTVDAQDNIRINGQTGFKIYVNGREDTMLESNYQRLLKAMPAESVKNIEVITEPGAKYDAEGLGGILNLITETKTQRDGYSGSIGLNYGARQAAAFGSFNGRLNKVYASANVTYADNGPSDQTNDQTDETIFLNNPDAYRQLTVANQKVKFGFVQAALNMSWEPNEKNLFTWGGSLMSVNAKIKDASSKTSLFDKAGMLQWAYGMNSGGKLNTLGATANASYRHVFGSDDAHRLLIGYQFNFGNNLLDFNTETHGIENYPVLLPWTINHNNNITREHTMQVDYSNPFGSGKHTLDAGAKVILRHNLGRSYGYVTDLPGNVPADNPNNVDVNQDQDVYAGYLSYTGNFDPVSVVAGIRYEHTEMSMDFKKGQGRNFTSHLNDWVPNAAVSYNFSPAHSLRLAYQMRISRPSIDQLNPYRMTVNTEIQTGNPDLTSERSNLISLTYTNFGRIMGGNVRIEYSRTSNNIINYSYFEDMYRISTFGNYGLTSRTTLSGFLNINITQKMTLSLNGEVNYTDIRSKQLDQRNSGWGGNYGISWSWTGPWDMKFNAYGGHALHMIDLQGWSSGWYYYGLGVGKDFLKNKSLHVTLSAGNFLTSRQFFKSHIRTADAIKNTNFSNKVWSVGLSVSWEFGNMKERVKSTGIDINNNDQSTARGNTTINSGATR